MKKRLTKSNNNRWFFGVIGGIGEYFGLDDQTINIIRIVYAILFFVGVGSPFLLYIILAIIMPKDYSSRESYQRSSYEYHEQPRRDQSHSQNYYTKSNPNNYGSNGRKIKEAEAVNDDDDWSDF
jgi:phage shock protein PspC (stress-responsive transcriptional regulator)